jgi:hypothetical protein
MTTILDQAKVRISGTDDKVKETKHSGSNKEKAKQT